MRVPNYIRLALSLLLMSAAVCIIIFSQGAWSIPFILLSILLLLTFFFNENMLLAQYHLRKNRMQQAQRCLNRIKNYEVELIKMQRGYYHLLLGLIQSQTAPLQSEKYFKRALALGMFMDHNIALAKLSLAGIAMSKRNKREATRYIQEAKKADKNKLLAEQIKMLEAQLPQVDRTIIRAR